MKLYVMRHGQTDWNVQQRAQGRTDIELNDVGIEQAKEAREKFAKLNIDLVITSPLKRAKKTAEIVSKKGVPILIDERITERCFGNQEGVTAPNLSQNFIKYAWDYEANSDDENIEPVQEVCARVSNLLDEVKEKYEDKNVLLVTHGGTARAINVYFQGADYEKLKESINFGNCEIREYNYGN